MDLLPESPVTAPRISSILAGYPKPPRFQGPGFDLFTRTLGRELATEALMTCVISNTALKAFDSPCRIFEYLYDYRATMEVGSDLVEVLVERVRRARLQERNESDIGRALSVATKIAARSLTDDSVTRILAGKQKWPKKVAGQGGRPRRSVSPTFA